MASPAMTRFEVRYSPIYDTIARLDIEQTLREETADKLAEALAARRPEGPAWYTREQSDFRLDLFRLLASDPLCPCAGFDDEPCPEQREIRIGMHLSTDYQGRSAAWEPRRPIVRCVSCGAKQFAGVPA